MWFLRLCLTEYLFPQTSHSNGLIAVCVLWCFVSAALEGKHFPQSPQLYFGILLFLLIFCCGDIGGINPCTPIACCGEIGGERECVPRFLRGVVDVGKPGVLFCFCGIMGGETTVLVFDCGDIWVSVHWPSVFCGEMFVTSAVWFALAADVGMRTLRLGDWTVPDSGDMGGYAAEVFIPPSISSTSIIRSAEFAFLELRLLFRLLLTSMELLLTLLLFWLWLSTEGFCWDTGVFIAAFVGGGSTITTSSVSPFPELFALFTTLFLLCADFTGSSLTITGLGTSVSLATNLLLTVPLTPSGAFSADTLRRFCSGSFEISIPSTIITSSESVFELHVFTFTVWFQLFIASFSCSL